jgi:hypothetical protein
MAVLSSSLFFISSFPLFLEWLRPGFAFQPTTSSQEQERIEIRSEHMRGNADVFGRDAPRG